HDWAATVRGERLVSARAIPHSSAGQRRGHQRVLRMQARRRGFTLMEIVVVGVILTVVAAIVVVGAMGYSNQKRIDDTVEILKSPPCAPFHPTPRITFCH